MSGKTDPPGVVDLPTLIAVAICAYAITNVAHEGGGHGGACVLMGGKPVELNAIYFNCGDEQLSAGAHRWVAAGGTLVNLALGGLTWAGLRAGRNEKAAPRATTTRYFVWLLMTLSLLQATGYWLFSGIGDIGDWAAVTDGLAPPLAWRALLTVGGALGYYLTVRVALRTLSPFLGAGAGRVPLARKLTLVPYLAGGLLYVAAGLRNPASPQLVLISAAAASFGGASALAWMCSLLENRARFPDEEAAPLALRRSTPWLAAGVGVAAVFIAVLGRSIRL